jgi:hypothetical protein
MAKLIHHSTRINTSNLVIPPTPALYLFDLGHVHQLRSTFVVPPEYDGNYTLCKWGRTKNLSNRTSQHQRTYGRMPGVSMSLRYFTHVDPPLLSKREKELKDFLLEKEWVLKHARYRELALIPVWGWKDFTEAFFDLGTDPCAQ